MAEALADYYHQMATSAAEMPRARVVEDTLSAHAIIPEDTAALSQAYRLQAGHYAAREAVARHLKALYDELAKLAADKPDDVVGAAADLEAAVARLNGEHHFGASLNGKHIDDALVQQHLNKVTSFLFDLQKAGKLRKANADTLGILAELKGLIDEEQGLYAEDAAVFAAEGHTLVVAMTTASFATNSNRDVFNSSSPLYQLLAPYNLQATQSNPVDVSNVNQVLTTFGVEENYRDAASAALTTPLDLKALLSAQIARQDAFAQQGHR